MRNINILLLLILFLGVFGCSTDKEVNEHFNKAREYRKKGDFSTAREEYYTIIYGYPKSLLVTKSKNLLVTCEEEIKIENTIKLADKLIENKHSDTALFIFRSLIDQNSDSYYAEEIRKKINILTDNSAEVILSKAVNYQKNDRLSEAVELYKKFIDNFPYHKEIENVKIYLIRAEELIEKINAQKEQEKIHAMEEQKRKEKEQAQSQAEKEKEIKEREKNHKENEKKRKIEDALKALKAKTR